MARVKELVTHILFHVNAEADGPSDPSQVAGVAERADLVRRAVSSILSDEREMTVDQFLVLLSSLVPVDTSKDTFQRTITNMAGDPRPQLAIQAWVGKNMERRGG